MKQTLILSLLLAVLLLVFTASIRGQQTPPRPAVYWGAYNAGSPWDLTIQDSFETLVGKPAAIIPFGITWKNCGVYGPFPADAMEAIRRRGSIPQIDWFAADSCARSPDQPDFRNAVVASGAHDAFIRRFAQQVRAWGRPFFLRLNPEMNGWWTWPYGEQVNGNQPGSFVQSWRHVHDIFVQEGATNATWVWCPNITSSRSTPYPQLYPGDAYVDWAGLDGYNGDPDAWQSFAQVFTGSPWNPYNSYQLLLDVAPNKPVLLSEFASAEAGDDGTRKASWVRDALEGQIPTYFPRVRAVIWYNLVDGRDWRVNSTPKALQTFAEVIGGYNYASNEFSTLQTSPIPPLSGE